MEFVTVSFTKTNSSAPTWNNNICENNILFSTELRWLYTSLLTLQERICRDMDVDPIEAIELEEFKLRAESVEMYKQQITNLLKRFNMYCELNNIEVTITLKNRGEVMKQFPHTLIYSNELLYNKNLIYP